MPNSISTSMRKGKSSGPRASCSSMVKSRFALRAKGLSLLGFFQRLLFQGAVSHRLTGDCVLANPTLQCQYNFALWLSFLCVAVRNAVLHYRPRGGGGSRFFLLHTGRGLFYIGYRYITPKKPKQHRAKVIPEKIQNSFVSLQPPISKWWWRGAIRKNRLPWVFLK